MPHHELIAISGVVEHVFAHRFTVLSDGKHYLADLGPKGAESFAVSPGLEVDLEGERRPSEIKVLRIARKGEESTEVEHKKPHHGGGPISRHRDGAQTDAEVAVLAATEAGFETTGKPKRHPKHFEVLARQGGGEWMELHVDLSGNIYKQKPAAPHKWSLG